MKDFDKGCGYASTRDVLIRSGMELLTERGFAATGLDAVLKRATVPKGSFYHYFASKDEFARCVMAAYDAYFVRKLDRWLGDKRREPLERIQDFMNDAKSGMARHRFTRGCLVGNLSQELEALPQLYRGLLEGVLQGWQQRIARCLRDAAACGQVSDGADFDALAEYFWIGWEGAVMRARLTRSPAPLDLFSSLFLAGLPK